VVVGENMESIASLKIECKLLRNKKSFLFKEGE